MSEPKSNLLSDARPIIAITMGDPVGVGPEIVCQALWDSSIYRECRPLVIGDAGVLKSAAAVVGRDFQFKEISSPGKGLYRPGTMDIVPVSRLDAAALVPGAPTKKTGRAMVEYIFKSIDWAMSGEVDAVTTGPIHKGAMNAAGFDYQGHTEIFAERTNTKKFVMMLAGERLKVTLVTIHMAIEKVPAALTKEKVLTTIEITHDALTARFGISRPRIFVAGLNPHAGEDGLFGDEESTIIAPAIKDAKGAGINVTGPHPADTLFYHAVKGGCDAVVCMYHDQGLIPFKLLHFQDGVNTTLGLPVIRTSVDHGTAYDIAWTGKADCLSLVAAIRMAAQQAANRG
ncbi:MAG: 4-hydroxythreonine-4-phosphate dehydrogenase PdxA [Desulfatibacillaceae bacterium]|nr:4-hydroxythreonine-4-phosphate dehydrogenase PdxA [Desulfatibacillaceae bacterium]